MIPLASPLLPIPALFSKEYWFDWPKRVIIALNPTMPETTRELLRRDGNRFVRAAMRNVTDAQPTTD